MTSVEVIAQRFSIIEGEPDMHEPITFVLPELQPAGFARAILGHCYSSARSESTEARGERERGTVSKSRKGQCIPSAPPLLASRSLVSEGEILVLL